MDYSVGKLSSLNIKRPRVDSKKGEKPPKKAKKDPAVPKPKHTKRDNKGRFTTNVEDPDE